MNRKRFVLFSLVSLLAGSAMAQQPNMDEVMKAMGAMLGGGTNTASVADFRELKALLPADLPGMKRTNAGGEKNVAMGMTIATAEGQYQSTTNDGATLHIKITDMGGTGAIGGFMQYGWASMEVDKEDDNGYERSTTIGGNKALEKYNSQDKRGEIQVLVNKHFTVEVSGYNVTMDQIKGAVAKIDLAKLGALQPKPAAPAP